jgi:hypothetical protein
MAAIHDTVLTDILGLESGSNRSQSVEISLWERLWACRKTDCGMNQIFTYRVFQKELYNFGSV